MPSAAEAEARDSLHGSVERNRHQVALTEESRRLLQAVLREDMREAFAEGLREAMTSENARQFVRVLLTEAQAVATQKTGQMVGSAVAALFKRFALFVFLGSIVYAFGGWSALATLAKLLAARD